MIDLYTGLFSWTDEPSILFQVDKAGVLVLLLVCIWMAFFLKCFPPKK